MLPIKFQEDNENDRLSKNRSGAVPSPEHRAGGAGPLRREAVLGYCSIFTLADSMRGVESQTGALTVALENLEKSVPASVTSTSGDEAGSV